MRLNNVILVLLIFLTLGCEKKDHCNTPYPNNLIIGKQGLCHIHYEIYDPPVIIKAETDGNHLAKKFNLSNDGTLARVYEL
jgi:hypothetical protein